MMNNYEIRTLIISLLIVFSSSLAVAQLPEIELVEPAPAIVQDSCKSAGRLEGVWLLVQHQTQPGRLEYWKTTRDQYDRRPRLILKNGRIDKGPWVECTTEFESGNRKGRYQFDCTSSTLSANIPLFMDHYSAHLIGVTDDKLILAVLIGDE